ncbi:Flp family type IVb pilin [Acetobacter conturbans]|uniref:Flp family type IVb pilin n=1 Tax=Acetobacter conturbans TaxID=1737472 RepID=A0ABX0K8H6_9PROT|nr:Flp family type IVb pilin [Acetobacter conturbans]NHN89694.1 Flp family type IVb pilin [Acetobacter conturbans]
MQYFLIQKIAESRAINRMRALLADREGVTAIEYALIAGLIAVASFTAMKALGGSLQTLFSSISTTLNSAPTATGS